MNDKNEIHTNTNVIVIASTSGCIKMVDVKQEVITQKRRRWELWDVKTLAINGWSLVIGWWGWRKWNLGYKQWLGTFKKHGDLGWEDVFYYFEWESTSRWLWWGKEIKD